MRKARAVDNRIQPEIVTPPNLLIKVAVSGQAEMPENIANHPFVSGRGPFSRRRRNPPPPAANAQAQAAVDARIDASLAPLRVPCFAVGSVGMDDGENGLLAAYSRILPVRVATSAQTSGT